MAIPDSTKNNQLRCDSAEIPAALPRANTIAQVKNKITDVRIARARLESIPCTPDLARIAVEAANTAESKDQ